MTIRFPVLLFPVLMVSAATAQQWEGSLSFGVASPQGDFRSIVGKNGYGVTGTIGYGPAENPFMVGVSAGYLVYGSESRKEPFSTTIPDVTVDVNTTNGLVVAQLLLKIQPNQGSFRPYLQGAAGIHYLFTTTEIRSENSFPAEEVASSTNESDVAFAYGGGAGILVTVHRSEDGSEGDLREVLINLGARYMFGGEARYLKEGSIRREGASVIYDTQQSITDLLLFEIGVALRF
jgi:hypothetical protein